MSLHRLLRRASLAGAGLTVLAMLAAARTAKLDGPAALVLGGLLVACVAGYIFAGLKLGPDQEEEAP